MLQEVPLVQDSVFARQAHAWHLHRLHGFRSTLHGPLVVPLLNQAEHNVGVYDAAGGGELNWFTGPEHAYAETTVASHIFEVGGQARLAVAPDGDPIRQWEIPSGEPVGAAIATGGRSRGLTSYERAGRTVLVVVDDRGAVRQFDADEGTPAGEPFQLPTGRLARLGLRLGRQTAPVVLGGAQTVTWDPWAAEPTLLVATREAVWRVGLDSGAITAVRPQSPAPIWGVLPDPRPERKALLLRIDGGIAVCDPADGHPVGPSAQLPRGYTEGFAAAASDQIRVFVADGARMLSWGGGNEPPDAILDPAGADENRWLEDLCVLPVGDRTAVFTSDASWIYRYDAVTGTPWPAADI